MPDFILIDGDIVNFMPNFAMPLLAVVTVKPGKIEGTGAATLNGTKLCVVGDETKVEVQGCTYTAGPYVTPGVGTLKIDTLAPNQKAQKTKTGTKLVLLKGSNFTAKFEVQTPAQQPTPTGPVPDSVTLYSGGNGYFTTTNTKFQGS